jgi:diguanylate cyclase (GGDEF)-like protein
LVTTYVDALTGLPDRKALFERLSELPTGDVVGALGMDVVDLRGLNDLYGHKGGDRILAALARRLSNAAYSGDLVARIGGDEFVVVADCVMGDEWELARFQRDVEAAISSTPIRLDDGDVTISVRVRGAVIGGPTELGRLFDA